MTTLTMTKLPKYAKILDALSDQECDAIVSHFENSKHKEDIDLFGYPTFTQVNLNMSLPTMAKYLTTVTEQVLEDYKDCYKDVTKYLPPFKRLESFRVKRYNSNSDDRFDIHVDVASTPASSRALSFLYYLNDNFTGGETEFEGWGKITPKKGTVLVFPPYWMFPHAGLPVITGSKYIMSTYLHVYDHSR